MAAIVKVQMALFVLTALQLVTTVVGFALLWRRIDALDGEVVRLRHALGDASSRRVAPRGRRVEGAAAPPPPPAPSAARQALARAVRAWRLPNDDTHSAPEPPSAQLTTGTQRGLALAVLAVMPAFALFLRAETPAIVACGLGLAAAMMLVGLRPHWRVAAWAGVLTAGVWTLIGFALAAAYANVTVFSFGLALAGAAGLAYAHLRDAAPGAIMALTMSTAAIALASQTGMIAPAGAAFGVIVVLSAIVGALSLRLEGVHLAAFGATLVGLFVLSGQNSAAIWFTPAAALAGAVFLAIAMVRVPQLGARGVALAGTGALAPILAIAALHASGHGLADPFAAAGAFAALGLGLSGLIGLAMSRRARGSSALKLTLWVLAAGALVAFAGAIVLVAPAPISAPAFAALALGLTALNARIPNAAWRTLACVSGVLCALAAWTDGLMLLEESPRWAPWALITLGLALPALLTGAAALTAKQARAPLTAGALECLAIALGVAGANLAVRAIFSAGAPLSLAIGFVEAGAHISVWLGAALVVGARARQDAVRLFAAGLLGFAALAAGVLISALWLTPYWNTRLSSYSWQSYQALGFLAPALMFYGNWVFWRARGANLRTRLALAAGALMTAGFVTLEATRADDMPDWASALVGAFIFASAIAINFAPGVTANPARRSYLQEDLHHDPHGEKRLQAR